MGLIVDRPPPCPECRPLGAFNHRRIRHELYVCLLRHHSIPIVDPEWPTFLARFGSHTDDFVMGIASGGQHRALREAKRRAVEREMRDPKVPLHPGMRRFVEALAELLIAEPGTPPAKGFSVFAVGVPLTTASLVGRSLRSR